jgi:hypothetical protein
LNLLLFQKSGRHLTAWYHFREFYSLRGMLSNAAISTLMRIFKR